MKPFNANDLLEMIKNLIEEKKNSYLQMFKEVDQSKHTGGNRFQ